MRVIWFLIFLVLVAIIVVFAFQNSDSIAINYPDQSFAIQSIHLPMSVLIGASYLLGMLTGWTVIGFQTDGAAPD